MTARIGERRMAVSNSRVLRCAFAVTRFSINAANQRSARLIMNDGILNGVEWRRTSGYMAPDNIAQRWPWRRQKQMDAALIRGNTRGHLRYGTCTVSG